MANSDWENSKTLARAMVHDRPTRRRVLSIMLSVAMGMMGLGLWPLEGWLGQNPLLFLAWWAVVAVLTLMVMIFALYDALAVIREERSRR